MSMILDGGTDDNTAPAPIYCTECGHPDKHHDAGECWTTADGRETWDDPPDKCDCWWYTPSRPGGAG